MSRSGSVGVGFITGMISGSYLNNLASFPDVRLVIVGDRDQHRSRHRPRSTTSLSRAGQRRSHETG